MARPAQRLYESIMRRFLQVTLIGFALGMVVLALTRAPDASASVAYTSPYTFDQTFGTSVRLLHVDMGFKILEKDREGGFIMFEYTSPESGNKPVNGSMELVEAKDGVHVAVQIPRMPQYHERMIIDQLAKKLESEHGTPAKGGDKDKDADKDKDKGGDKDKDKDKGDKDKDKGGDKDKDKDGDKKSADDAALEASP